MTWNEFKEFVDRELADARCDGDIEIDYIDISMPDFKYSDKHPHLAVEYSASSGKGVNFCVAT